jgi:hypothetical protein
MDTIAKKNELNYLSFAAPFPFQPPTSFFALADMKFDKSTKTP